MGVDLFNLATADLGRLAVALVDAGTLVLGSPTVLGGAHPLVANAAYVANLLKPRARCGAIIGSYGWGGKMVAQLAGLMPTLKLELFEPVTAKGLPEARRPRGPRPAGGGDRGEARGVPIRIARGAGGPAAGRRGTGAPGEDAARHHPGGARSRAIPRQSHPATAGARTLAGRSCPPAPGASLCAPRPTGAAPSNPAP